MLLFQLSCTWCRWTFMKQSVDLMWMCLAACKILLFFYVFKQRFTYLMWNIPTGNIITYSRKCDFCSHEIMYVTSKVWHFSSFILSFKSPGSVSLYSWRNSALGQPGGHRKRMKIKLAATVVLMWNNMWEFRYKSVLSDTVALIFYSVAETVIQTIFLCI